jgi:hypothetical protein
MTTKIKSGVIGDNVVGITQLNVSDGTNGQVLTTDGSGTLSFSTISGYTDSDVETYLNTSEIYTDPTNNRLSIGTASPSAGLLTLSGVDGGSTAGIYFNNTTASTGKSYRLNSGNTGEFMLYDITSSAYRLFVNTSGDVGIGTASPNGKLHVEGATTTTNLLIDDSTGYGVYVSAQNSFNYSYGRNETSTGYINFRGYQDGNTQFRNLNISNGKQSTIAFFNGVNKQVGIGTTNPDAPLHIEATNASMLLSNSGRTQYWRVQNNEAADAFTINASDVAERFRIDSIGRVGINRIPSITNSKLEVGGADNVPLINVEASGATGGMGIGSTGLQLFHGSTARMKIHSTGYMQVGLLLQGDSLFSATETRENSYAGAFYNKASSPYGMFVGFQDASPNNATNRLLTMNDYIGDRAVFYSNGGLYNYQSNDSNLSDEREKKNIEDLSSTWDCVKSWNLRKFHYNEDEDSDHKRLGVIAQEVEVECPEVITEWKKQEQKDEVLWTEEDELPEGVSVGDVKTAAQEEIIRKGVKEQQMYWMAIKALQEAMTKIEDLKARIETLENA